MRNAPNNRIAKMALSVALLSCLFGQTVSLPAMAQYSLQAETDSFLPPEVVPLDPAVAKKMSQAQAQARQESANNSNSYGQNSAMSGNPSGGNNSGMNDFNNQNNSQQARQDMMNNMMSQGGMNQGQPNFSQSNMGGQEVPGNTGTSDWIMPGQDQNSPTTAYGNVSQTQTLNAPPSNPIVRRGTRRAGMGTAMSALATFGAGAMVGTMIRRPNSLYGLGATGLMMTGFGTRNAFRF